MDRASVRYLPLASELNQERRRLTFQRSDRLVVSPGAASPDVPAKQPHPFPIYRERPTQAKPADQVHNSL